MNRKLILVSLVCMFIDQITKYIIIVKMNLLDSIEIIKSFFKITYVRNYGAAFNILDGNKILLILITIGVLFFIYWIYLRNKTLDNFQINVYGLLIGGILGNLIDRIMFGYVIDFLDFKIIGYNFPIFNMADIWIVVAVGLIIIKVLFWGDDLSKDI